MQRSTRSLATLAACALTVIACTGFTATASAKQLDLVVLGDSYSSGNGAGNYYDLLCGRSSTAWGERYASLLRARGTTVTVKNAACQGGTLPDLDGQINAITPSTDLVALTIGGNDVGFANIVIQCFAAITSDPGRCKTAINNGINKIPLVQAGALAKLEKFKSRLRPGAKVVVLSYPYLASPSNYTLRGLFGAYKSGVGARLLGDKGDLAVKNAAAIANAAAGETFVQFIPTKDLFRTHEPNPDPYRENASTWVWEFNQALVNEYYHPKPAGYAAMAQALLRAGGTAGDFGVAE